MEDETQLDVTSDNLHLWRGFEPYAKLSLQKGSTVDGPEIRLINDWTIPYIGIGLNYEVDPIELNIQMLTDIIQNHSFYKNPHVLERIWELSEKSDPPLRFILRIILTPSLHDVFIPNKEDLYLADVDAMDNLVQDIVERVDLFYVGFINPDFIELKKKYPGILPQVIAMVKYFANFVPEKDQWRKRENITQYKHVYYVFFSTYDKNMIILVDGKLSMEAGGYSRTIVGISLRNLDINTGTLVENKVFNNLGVIFGIYGNLNQPSGLLERETIIFSETDVSLFSSVRDTIIKGLICESEEITGIYPLRRNQFNVVTTDDACYYARYREIIKVSLPSPIAYINTEYVFNFIVFEAIGGMVPIYVDNMSMMLPENIVSVNIDEPDYPLLYVLSNNQWISIDDSQMATELFKIYGDYYLWKK